MAACCINVVVIDLYRVARVGLRGMVCCGSVCGRWGDGGCVGCGRQATLESVVSELLLGRGWLERDVRRPLCMCVGKGSVGSVED